MEDKKNNILLRIKGDLIKVINDNKKIENKVIYKFWEIRYSLN